MRILRLRIFLQLHLAVKRFLVNNDTAVKGPRQRIHHDFGLIRPGYVVVQTVLRLHDLGK